MADITQQMAELEGRINALQQQYADLAQQLQEDPQRQASCNEVAAAVQRAKAEAPGGLSLEVLPVEAGQGTQIHPDYVYLVLPATGPWNEVQALREKMIAAGGEQGNKPERVYIHREKALPIIAAALLE